MAEEKAVENVKLRCAVYGEGSVLSVGIERDADVKALQEVIAGIVSTEQHVVPPRLVTLYLAKKNGAWLKDDDSVDGLLSGKIDIAYKKMRPSWKLNKTEYFGNFQLGEEEIHVLVELPEAAAGVASTSQDMKELIKAAVGELMDEREEKQSAYSLSDLNSELGERIIEEDATTRRLPRF
ncbi:unnamed protein product [Phytophthora lilii]|uniref:Unnamed protein product n=2 Tax=Phytophthora lilii TaxID=2077276 RepID=A0A9W6TTM8_9STRA|nr:unnamed protein product [Phytophthora lilii]